METKTRPIQKSDLTTILELTNQGKTQKEIAKILTSRGITTPKGRMLKQENISQFMINNRSTSTRKRKRSKAKTARPFRKSKETTHLSPTLAEDVLGLIDAKLSHGTTKNLLSLLLRNQPSARG